MEVSLRELHELLEAAVEGIVSLGALNDLPQKSGDGDFMRAHELAVTELKLSSGLCVLHVSHHTRSAG